MSWTRRLSNKRKTPAGLAGVSLDSRISVAGPGTRLIISGQSLGSEALGGRNALTCEVIMRLVIGAGYCRLRYRLDPESGADLTPISRLLALEDGWGISPQVSRLGASTNPLLATHHLHGTYP